MQLYCKFSYDVYNPAMTYITKVRSLIYQSVQQFLLYLLRSLRKKRRIHSSIEKLSKLDKDSSSETGDTLDMSIIVATFEARFFEYTIPLIAAIRSEFSLPIFVMINGNYLKTDSNFKLQEFISELSKFSNVYPTAFSNFRGCSELWNTGIVNADSEIFLIFNDDIHIFPNLLKNNIGYIAQRILENGLVMINRSFSHFGVSRKCIEEVGFFDEHFLGMGEEDRDYFYRYESRYLKKPDNLSSDAFYHFGDESRDESIKQDSEKKQKFLQKYSYFNSAIRHEFYSNDPRGSIQGQYDFPVERIKIFVNPRPLWGFRQLNYRKLAG